jgi:four helix bundle protein
LGADVEIRSEKDLVVYQKAFDVAMQIFELSRRFPAEERYALTGQIRRSSRSVCTNLSEAWAKRRYEAHFVSKLTDSDGENSETETSLDFALACKYIDSDRHSTLVGINKEIGRMLGSMIQHPKKFLIPKP